MHPNNADLVLAAKLGDPYMIESWFRGHGSYVEVGARHPHCVVSVCTDTKCVSGDVTDHRCVHTRCVNRAYAVAAWGATTGNMSVVTDPHAV